MSMPLPSDERDDLDERSLRIVEEFEAAWETGRPDVADHLARHPDRPVRLLLELAAIDIENRMRRGEPTHVEDYCHRFPDLAASERLVRELHDARDLAARRSRDSDPGMATSDESLMPAPAAAMSWRGFPFLGASAEPGTIGTLGHYAVIRQLGQGAFGLVFEAFDGKLHRRVAIKVLSPELATTSPPRKRFIREARAMAAVTHENVVRVYAVEEEPTPHLVMEFVDGQTLQQRMDSGGPFDVAEVVHIARQIAAALAAAHDTGLIHRDIKPANVLLERGPTRRVRLTDFGLARAADDASMTRSGTVVGTPMYMAPEQALGATVDHRADLFSLGSVLYAMTCGRPPFRAPSTVAVLKRVAEDTPRPIPEIIPEVPRWLVDVIARLHRKDPAERFQSAHEVERIFAKAQADPAAMSQLVLVPPKPAGDTEDSELFHKLALRPQKPTGKSRGRWLAAAAVAAGLAIAAWLAREPLGSRRAGVLARSEKAPAASAPAAVPAAEGTVAAGNKPAPTVGDVAAPIAAVAAALPARPEPSEWEPGPPLQGLSGIVTNPVLLPGIARWQAIQRVPPGNITSIDWSSRDQIAVGADDGLVRVYDAATMTLVRVFGPHGRQRANAAIVSVRWSPDGTLLASHGMGLRVWNIATGVTEVSIPDRAYMAKMSWHPAGGKLAVVQEHHKDVRVVDVATKDVGSPPQEAVIFSCDRPGSPLADVWNVAWSPDGSKLACAGTPSRDGDVHRAMAVLLSPSGEIEKTVQGKAEAYSADTRAIAWSPDGRRLALGATKFGGTATCVVEVVSIDSGEATVVVPPDSGQPPQITSVHWSPVGDTLYCVFNDFTQAFYTEPAPRRSQRFDSGQQNASGSMSPRFAISPDGSLAATIHGESTGLRIFRTKDATTVRHLWNEGERLGTGTRCRHLADGSLLMVTGVNQRTCRVISRDGSLTHGPWPLSCGKALNMHLHPHPTDPTTFAAVRFPQTGVWRVDGLQRAAFDGKMAPLWVASPGVLGLTPWGTSELRMVDDSGQTQRTLTLPAPHADYEDLQGASVGGPDRRRIAYVTSPDNTARVVEIGEDRSAIGEIFAPPGDAKPIQVALDPSGDRVAMRYGLTGIPVSVVQIADSKRVDFHGHTWRVNDICWSSSGSVLYSASQDGRCFAWHPESGRARPFELVNTQFTGVSADPTTGAVAVKTHAQEIYCLDALSLTPRWSFAVLPDEAYATFSPGGEMLHGDRALAEKHLAWIVDQEDGTRRILSREEFSAVAAEARSRNRPEDPVAGLPPDEVEAGFRRLTRRDWYVYDRERNGNTWQIGDDGLSAVHQLRDGHPHVWTRDEYRDFDLRFDMRLTGGARDVRTAVCFATPLGGWESMKREGCVMCSLAGDGFISAVAGAATPAAAEVRPGLIRANDWNAVRLTAAAGVVKVFVNGEPLGSLVLPAPLRDRSAPISLQFPALSNRTGGDAPDPFEPGLAKGEFRNLRIRRLDDAAAATPAR